MRKILLVIILPFLAVACGDDLFDIAFNYQFDGDFQVPALAAGLHDIDSDIMDLAVLEELDERNLASITSASLQHLSLLIPETEQLNWDFVESAEVFMIVDGQETPMASLRNIPTTIGNKLELDVEADEFKLVNFLDANTAQARLRVNLRSAIPKTLNIEVAAGTRITASAQE